MMLRAWWSLVKELGDRFEDARLWDEHFIKSYNHYPILVVRIQFLLDSVSRRKLDEHRIDLSIRPMRFILKNESSALLEVLRKSLEMLR